MYCWEAGVMDEGEMNMGHCHLECQIRTEALIWHVYIIPPEGLKFNQGNSSPLMSILSLLPKLYVKKTLKWEDIHLYLSASLEYEGSIRVLSQVGKEDDA